jgi:DNA-binding NarL/FixJ family response regulator
MSLPTESLRVLLVEQRRLPRESLHLVLGAARGLRCEAVETSDAVPASVEVDVVVVASHATTGDLSEVAGSARARFPGSRVVAIGDHVDGAVAEAAAVAGADVVLTTDSSVAALVTAVRTGEGEGSPAHLSKAADERARARARQLGVTERQHEVLRELATGAPPQIVARRLGIAVDTCRDHVKALRSTLDCSSTSGLLVEAVRRGLVPTLGRASAPS